MNSQSTETQPESEQCLILKKFNRACLNDLNHLVENYEKEIDNLKAKVAALTELGALMDNRKSELIQKHNIKFDVSNGTQSV